MEVFLELNERDLDGNVPESETLDRREVSIVLPVFMDMLIEETAPQRAKQAQLVSTIHR